MTIDSIIQYITKFMTPEIAILGAAMACFLAVITLLLAGRYTFVQGLESRFARLKVQIAEREKILSDIGQKTAEAEMLKQRVEHSEKRFVALQQELKPLEEKHLKALVDYEDAKSKLRETREQWDLLSEKVQLYQERVASLDNLEREIKQLEEMRNELNALIESLPDRRKELDELSTRADKLEKYIEELTAKSKSLEDEVKASNERLRDLRKTEEELDKALAEKQARLSQLKTESQMVDIALASKRGEIGSKTRLTAEAFESLSERVFDWGKLLNTKDERTMLAGLRDHIDEMKFDYSERLQWAFHTALKTSDISCLTVMAGVSGTGKSALPRLYAKAMGVHFLPIAVEPGWDSPQDLFGFFNYMENRFEATRLGRALMQFSNINHEHSMKDQMLIVLLDEMNLAKIEYYFSEFLSLLELRRDVDLNNLEDFQKVCVEIFPGGGDKDKKEEPIRLFAGSNVLFVGTMNEDESTQSLSDKVIDRANVLYFGKPAKLKSAERTNVVNQSSGGALPFETWSSWQKPVSQDFIQDFSKLSNQLSVLNEMLGELGRPFAHRTYQAMLKYIANYPDLARGYQRPLADQIAMRIMPKLRGVDLSDNKDAFNNLEQFIHDCKDNALIDAFLNARKNPQGFFQWRGIDWATEL